MQTAISPLTIPYYWAAFILLGNTTPLVQECRS